MFSPAFALRAAQAASNSALSRSGLCSCSQAALALMPAAMKSAIVTAVAAETNGALRQVQLGAYLILTSNYYNVWH